MMHKIVNYVTSSITITGSLIGGYHGFKQGQMLTMNEPKLFDSTVYNTSTTVYEMFAGGVMGTLWFISVPILFHQLYIKK